MQSNAFGFSRRFEDAADSLKHIVQGCQEADGIERIIIKSAKCRTVSGLTLTGRVE